VSGCWEWSGAVQSKGYGYMTRNKRNWLAHRRMAWCLGVPIKGLCVLHKCDNPACVRPSHLFVGTPADNSGDMVQKGRSCRGEKQGQSVLTVLDVQEIRSLAAAGRPHVSIAAEFGVSDRTINGIAARKRWGWLK